MGGKGSSSLNHAAQHDANQGTLLSTKSSILEDSARSKSETPMSLTPMKSDQADTTVREAKANLKKTASR